MTKKLIFPGYSFTVAMKEEAFMLLWLTTALVIPFGKIELFIYLLLLIISKTQKCCMANMHTQKSYGTVCALNPEE